VANACASIGCASGTDDGVDAGSSSASADGGPPSPLNLCSLFDKVFACGGNRNIPTGKCVQPDAGIILDERLVTWASYVMDNFITVVSTDCRVAGAFTAAGGVDMGTAWVNELPDYITQLFGCSAAGPLTYDLPPPELAGYTAGHFKVVGHVYTTADLNALSQDFVLAAQQVLAGQGDNFTNPGAGPAPPPNTEPDGGPFSLSPSQRSSLDAWLAYLQSKAGAVNSTNYTFEVSPNDSGPCP
jgi:hypothetical protein